MSQNAVQPFIFPPNSAPNAKMSPILTPAPPVWKAWVNELQLARLTPIHDSTAPAFKPDSTPNRRFCRHAWYSGSAALLTTAECSGTAHINRRRSELRRWKLRRVVVITPRL